jgi:Protein of unknown function (DUF2917)
MWIKTANARMALTAQRATRLNRACGATLRGLRGTAWVTIDGDRRDIVLEPGDSFVVDSSQPLLILPLRDDATIEVVSAAAPQRCAGAGEAGHGLGRALLRLLRQAWGRTFARPGAWPGLAST